MHNTKVWLWCECALLFLCLPIVLSMVDIRGMLFATLWLLALGCLVSWKRMTGRKIRSIVSFSELTRSEVKRMLPRFAISMVCLLGLTYLLVPERLFSFMLEKPQLWIIVMIFYPLLSVIPQEIIYRVFFFERYASIFPKGWMMVAASAFAFGHAHVMFNNPIAYWLSVAGGVIFALTYARTKSFCVVWFEHAMYGCYVFTVGLGWYFYSGAAHLH